MNPQLSSKAIEIDESKKSGNLESAIYSRGTRVATELSSSNHGDETPRDQRSRDSSLNHRERD